MDQTYGPTAPGDVLQWIDNASIGVNPPKPGGKFPVRPAVDYRSGLEDLGIDPRRYEREIRRLSE